MEIGSPSYIPSETVYVFPINNSSYGLTSKATYLEGKDFPDAPDVKEESANQVVENFLAEFIEKTKRHFATPLRSKTVLSRLTHVWEGLPVANTAQEPGWYTVTWKPLRLKIAPREFCLIWKAVELQTAEPLIPSEYIVEAESRSPSPAPEIRTIQLQQSTSSANSIMELEPTFTDSADSRMMTLDYEAPTHRLEKKKIREAKLRAALASLKAERLAEKYYQKYGSLPGEDSSDLSSESELEES